LSKIGWGVLLHFRFSLDELIGIISCLWVHININLIIKLQKSSCSA